MNIKSLRYIYLVLLSLIFHSNEVFSQNDLELTWAKSINNTKPFPGYLQPKGIVVDKDGSVFVTGTFLNNADFDPGPGVFNLTSAGDFDIFLAKYSPNGDLIFALSFGGNSKESSGGCAIDEAGNVYITGTFKGKIYIDTEGKDMVITSKGATNTNDIFIAKFSNDGNPIYFRNIFSTGVLDVREIACDAIGTCVITGMFSGTIDYNPAQGSAIGTTNGRMDIFFAKYDSNGTLIFGKNIGGPSDDSGIRIKISKQNNIFITGYFYGTVDFDPDAGVTNIKSYGLTNDIFFAKYTPEGMLEFAKVIGGSSNESPSGFAVDSSENIYISGSFNKFFFDFDPGPGEYILTSKGNSDFFLAKYSVNGDFILVKTMNGAGNATGIDIITTDDGNLFLHGVLTGTVDFDPGDDTLNLVSAGAYDIFLAKFSNVGDLNYAFRIGGIEDDFSRCLTVNQQNVIYITGYFTNAVDFDPGMGSAIKTVTPPIQNGFIASYSNLGIFQQVFTLGNYNALPAQLSDTGRAIVTDESGNIYITGQFRGDISFGDEHPETLQTSKGGSDIFIAKLEGDGNPIWIKSIGGLRDDAGLGIKLDSAGNVMLFGTFRGEVDFDPGPSVVNIISSGGINDVNSDIFFARYTNSGSFINVQKIGNDSLEIFQSASIDKDENIYLTGSFKGIVDFDPSPNQTLLESSGSTDLFFISYDSAGALRFAKRIGGINADLGTDIAIQRNGKILLTGNVGGIVDINPNNEIDMTSGPGIFFAIFDSSGTFLKGKHLNGNLLVTAINESFDGKIFITGTFRQTVDMDPGAAENNITLVPNALQNNIYFACYDQEGNFIFAKSIGNTRSCNVYDIIANNKNQILISGIIIEDVDFDPGPGTSIPKRNISRNGFIAAYDSLGRFLFTHVLGGSLYAEFNNITTDSTNSIYSVGFLTNTANFATGSAVSMLSAINSNDIFLAKYHIVHNVYKTAMNGNWSNPETWVGGMVPPEGADILVGHILQVDVNAKCKSMKFLVGGQVQIAQGILFEIME